MRKNSAFTLSETLIMVAIVGIIAIISVVSLRGLKPDKDAVLIRKAYNEIAKAVYALANDEELYPSATRTAALNNNWLASVMFRTMADTLKTDGDNKIDEISTPASPTMPANYTLWVWRVSGIISPNSGEVDSADKYTTNNISELRICTLGGTTLIECGATNPGKGTKVQLSGDVLNDEYCTAKNTIKNQYANIQAGETLTCGACIILTGSPNCTYEGDNTSASSKTTSASSKTTSSSWGTSSITEDTSSKTTSASSKTTSASSKTTSSSGGGFGDYSYSDYCKTNYYDNAAACSFCNSIPGGCGDEICVLRTNMSPVLCTDPACQNNFTDTKNGCIPFTNAHCEIVMPCYNGDEPASSMISSGGNSLQIGTGDIWKEVLSSDILSTSNVPVASSNNNPFGSSNANTTSFANLQLSPNAKSSVFTDTEVRNSTAYTSNNKFAYNFAKQFTLNGGNPDCEGNTCTFTTKDNMSWTVEDHFNDSGSGEKYALVKVDINGTAAPNSDNPTGKQKPDTFVFKIGAGGAISIYTADPANPTKGAIKAGQALSVRDPRAKNN
ncbi:hypothetical protein IKE67_01065 [bacterium]|nr:hypothetical protein [bacterium]